MRFEDIDIAEELKALVGAEAARKVCEYYAGQSVYFPLSVLKASVYDDIFKAYNSGLSFKKIAAKFGYTKNYVRRIVCRKIKEARERRKQSGVKPVVIEAAARCVPLPKETNIGELFNGN